MKAANSHRMGRVRSMRDFGVSVVVMVMLFPQARYSSLAPRLRGEAKRRSPPHPSSNPEQPRIARLDLFGHLLDALRILLHQLDVGNLPPSRLRLHLRVNGI